MQKNFIVWLLSPSAIRSLPPTLTTTDPRSDGRPSSCHNGHKDKRMDGRIQLSEEVVSSRKTCIVYTLHHRFCTVQHVLCFNPDLPFQPALGLCPVDPFHLELAPDGKNVRILTLREIKRRRDRMRVNDRGWDKHISRLSEMLVHHTKKNLGLSKYSR